MRKNTNDQKGFTLIELLIVIVIIGVLAGVVLLILNPVQQRNRARDAVIVSTMNKVTAEVRAFANSDLSGSAALPTCLQLEANIVGAKAECNIGGEGTFTVDGVMGSDANGASALVEYTYSPNDPTTGDFCLSAPAQDTTGGAFIRLWQRADAQGDPTPTRGATGCAILGGN